jgi:hypothetical protein
VASIVIAPSASRVHRRAARPFASGSAQVKKFAVSKSAEARGT